MLVLEMHLKRHTVLQVFASRAFLEFSSPLSKLIIAKQNNFDWMIELQANCYIFGVFRINWSLKY